MSGGQCCEVGERTAYAQMEINKFGLFQGPRVRVHRLLGCCGIEEILGVTYGITPEEILQAVCRDGLGTRSSPVQTGCGHGLSALFTWSAALNTATDLNNGTAIKNPGGGEQLAVYIAKHKLGQVVFGGEAPNRKWHPQHLIKVWVWTVDVEALKTWWSKHEPKPETEPKEKV